MLFYSIFPKENLCIFSAAGELTLDEMRICHQELAAESEWPHIETILTDLRGCWNVDSAFADHHARRRMELNAFGTRRMIWLTGSSTVLGRLAMAENESSASRQQTNIFKDKDELRRGLSLQDAAIVSCLDSLE